jgi:hypothetical protein
MHLSLFVVAVLSAAPGASSGGRGLQGAPYVLHIPRLDKLDGVTSFLRRAGERAPILNPRNWRSEFHPLVSVDVSDRQSIELAGIDPQGPATLSLSGDTRASCVTLANPKRFEDQAADMLRRVGTLWKPRPRAGITAVGADNHVAIIAGYANKGRESCAVVSPDSAPVLQNAQSRLFRAAAFPAARTQGLPGDAFVLSPYATVGLRGSDRHLVAEGRTTKLPLPKLRPAGESPYPPPTTGLMSLRARVDTAGLSMMVDTVREQLVTLCPSCDAKALGEAARSVVPLLTGHVMLRVDGLRIRRALGAGANRYFAVRHAWVAEVSSPTQVKAALAAFAQVPGVKPTADGYLLTAPGGEVDIGLRGRHLYVGNDQAAVASAFQGLSGSHALAHGAEMTVDPDMLGRALSKVSFFDVMGSKELAAVFAVSAEMGPLLASSEKLTGWADSEKDHHRFAFTWTLRPLPPAAPNKPVTPSP